MRDPGTRHDFAAGDRAGEQSQAIHWLAADPAHEARRVAVAPKTAVPARCLPGFRIGGRRRNFKIQGARGPRFGDECLPMDDANPFRRSVYIHGNIEGRRHPEPNACRPIDERRHGTARVPSIAGVLRTVEAVFDRDGGRRHRTVTVPEPPRDPSPPCRAKVQSANDVSRPSVSNLSVSNPDIENRRNVLI